MAPVMGAASMVIIGKKLVKAVSGKAFSTFDQILLLASFATVFVLGGYGVAIYQRAQAAGGGVGAGMVAGSVLLAALLLVCVSCYIGWQQYSKKKEKEEKARKSARHYIEEPDDEYIRHQRMAHHRRPQRRR